MAYEIGISKITVCPSEFIVACKVKKNSKDKTASYNKTYKLRFNPALKWNPYELLKKIALWMYENKGHRRKVFGKQIRNDMLKITEDDFQKNVYYLWSCARYANRIGKRGVFRLYISPTRG